jgi:hypothetical protein
MQRPFAPRALTVAGMAAGILLLAASSIVVPEYNSALHWNGRSWRASSFPRKLIVAFAAAFSSSDT